MGQVSKWLDNVGTLGDSAITEVGGRVGIGTTAPDGPLHIFGSPTADVFAGMGPNLIAGPGFTYGYAGSSFGRSAGFFNVRPDAAAVAPNPPLRFLTGNVKRMIVTNVGNVGIGTTSPGALLHVQSAGAGNVSLGPIVGNTAYGALSLNGSLADTSYNLISGPGDTNLYINRPAGKTIQFQEGGSSIGSVTLAAGGNVGIGTSVPSAKLEVVVGTGNGVRGYSFTHAGVTGGTNFGTGVFGYTDGGTPAAGVRGYSPDGTGVYGSSSTGRAGYFDGKVTVTGTLTKGGGSFKI